MSKKIQVDRMKEEKVRKSKPSQKRLTGSNEQYTNLTQNLLDVHSYKSMNKSHYNIYLQLTFFWKYNILSKKNLNNNNNNKMFAMMFSNPPMRQHLGSLTFFIVEVPQ